MSEHALTRHVSGAAPRVLIADGSRVVRQLIERVLKNALPDSIVHACESGAAACRVLDDEIVDLVTTALLLPDMDGVELACRVRAHEAQAYIPIIVVSGDVEERLVARTLSGDVTDYFDKAQGYTALAAFVCGYLQPPQQASGRVLYVEDSRVVALATTRMLEKCGFAVTHVVSVEAALEHLSAARVDSASERFDLVLTDVNLKGGLTGGDLVERIRGDLACGKRDLPVLVMTGDENAGNQTALLRAGANDLVAKPVEERVLINKLVFQLGVSRRQRESARRFS